jgi:hypothetical protein
VSSAFVSTNSTLGRRLTVLVSQNLTVTMTVFGVDVSMLPQPQDMLTGFSGWHKLLVQTVCGGSAHL